MTAVVLEQPALFDALAAGHVVSVTDEQVSYIAGTAAKSLTWFGWFCSCGDTSLGRSSHRDLAARKAQHHADKAMAA